VLRLQAWTTTHSCFWFLIVAEYSINFIILTIFSYVMQ
jgi:hypothetical protein